MRVSKLGFSLKINASSSWLCFIDDSDASIRVTRMFISEFRENQSPAASPNPARTTTNAKTPMSTGTQPGVRLFTIGWLSAETPAGLGAMEFGSVVTFI